MIEGIIQAFEKSVKKAFPHAACPIDIRPATQEQFGHYQCNSAMPLAKSLHRPPREIAQALIDSLEDQEKRFSKVEIAGPGFINITLSEAYLSSRVDRMVRDPRLGVGFPKKKFRVIVEFSSPNIAKEMHVGHLRSTIIGDCIARLFEFLGHDVLRLNHIGDWGTAFGMLIAYMRDEAPDVLHGKKEAMLSDLMEWYRAAKRRFDMDEAFKKRSRHAVVQLQSGEPDSQKAWELLCAISRKAFQQVYDLLDVRLQERGESFYNPMLPKVVADLESKGLITISEGAKCVFHEGFRIPLMVQKSDGGYNYDTTDMAAMLHRIQEEKADRIIILTDAGQSLHFDLIRQTCLKAGYLDPERVRFDHVPFGVVLGEDGKKFRTRSGEAERLSDLLYAAVDQARSILMERRADMPPNELEHLAHVLGIGAVKYSDLACNRISDYVFSYERMLRFEGNTAVFLLYSYVRVAGIKRKIGIANIDSVLKKAHIELKHPSEILLGLHLARFSDVLQAMQEDLLPNYLTDYLYELAQKFNGFFRDCRVEGSAQQANRLLLCEAVKKTMECGFHILGLKTVERM